MPFALNRLFRQAPSIGKIIALSLVLSLWLVQPARGHSFLWQQYHACGKQALEQGNWQLAERYLIGSLQAARQAKINSDESEMQDLLSDLSQLASQFEKRNNYKESEYIANWRMSVIGKDTRLASQQGMDLLANPPQTGVDGQSEYIKTQSGGGTSSPSGRPPGWDGHQPGCNDGHDRCGRDRECLEKAIEFLKRSMNQCALGINAMNNLAK